MANKKTVWVLGAGFSKPLGGPLLTQLLTQSSGEDLEIRFPSERRLRGELPFMVRRLYQLGMRFAGGFVFKQDDQLLPGEDVWRDAEEFIEYLDTAADDPRGPLAQRIERLLGRLESIRSSKVVPTLNELRFVARRIVAAECCAFLAGVNTTFEKWDPYRSWVQKLRFSDTIVTFNYDRVIENLGANNVKGGVPSDDWNEHAQADLCRVLKLHGSVDWCRENNGASFRVDVSPDFAVSCDDAQLSIATPGPTKRSAANELKALWSQATIALREADSIVFVGYRFPPSDAEARSKLLGAIGDNRQFDLKLNIVLGPHIASPDAIRLEHLLRAKCIEALRVEGDPSPSKQATTFQIRKHALWAEDFFSVWSRQFIE